MKKNVAIVAGGDSSEKSVSMRSASGLYAYIDSERFNKYIITVERKQWYVELFGGIQVSVDKNDFSFMYGGKKINLEFAYNTIHGTPGENGKIQGYFDIMNIPYSGCNVLASALTFDKQACKTYLKACMENVPGLHIAKSMLLKKGEPINKATIESNIGFPLFVKPNDGGSSFGTNKVNSIDQLNYAIEEAFAESNEIMVEEFISGTEVTCGCYKTIDKQQAFPPTEIVSQNEFFDYAAKYNGEVEEITPARISDELTKEVQRLTQNIYDVFNCDGIIRVDYIISEKGIYFLEVNTAPGMTSTSLIPQQVKAAGLNISTILTEVIEDSLNKKQ